MSGFRRFVNEVGDRLAEIEDTLIEGNSDTYATNRASELVRDLSEYVDRTRTALDGDGIEAVPEA